jgi:hypothetical protein|tara:strand:+ start:293 stop:721 length:429 start_codon:yes stop_codon:yes gene_type:complete
MNLELIENLWDEDSKIDNDELHTESTKVPSLHSKYYKIYNNILVLKKGQENKYKVLRRDKWEYYSGKASPEVYVEKPFDFKVLKADLDKYLDADDELIKCISKIDYYDIMLSYLESILKVIQNRTYQIKNAIEWQRFIRGYD